jgi:hypothetical protein
MHASGVAAACDVCNACEGLAAACVQEVTVQMFA